MKDKNQEYDELISTIRSGKPELDDPKGLTSEILSAVKKLSVRPKNIPLRIVSWVSSVAAALLLGVFLQGQSTPIVLSAQKLNVSSFGSYSLEGINLEEGITLDKVNATVREKRELRKERESFYLNIVNKYKNR